MKLCLRVLGPIHNPISDNQYSFYFSIDDGPKVYSHYRCESGKFDHLPAKYSFERSLLGRIETRSTFECYPV